MNKNITFSADERLIRLAREKSSKQKKSLNDVFRQWLENYAVGGTNAVNYSTLMKQLKHVKSGKSFSRDELNER